MRYGHIPAWRLRMGGWLLLAIVGVLVIWTVNPHMVEQTLYKLSLVPAGAFAYYWLDRAISERDRPHELLERAEEKRRDAKTESEPKRGELLREAIWLEAWARDRYMRRTILIAAGLIALALAS